MRKKGLSLLEILISTIILALLMIGLGNIFVAGKKLILHSRSRMTGGELGKYFLDPFQMQVKQSDWNGSQNDYVNTNLLHRRQNDQGQAVILDRTYTPYYTVDDPPGFLPQDQMRSVRVDITWDEPTP